MWIFLCGVVTGVTAIGFFLDGNTQSFTKPGKTVVTTYEQLKQKENLRLRREEDGRSLSARYTARYSR